MPGAEPKEVSKKTKYLITGSIWLAFVAFGCAFTICSYLQYDLMKQMDASLGELSRAFSIRNGGYLAGAMTVTFIYSRFNEHMIFGSCLLSLGVCMALVPFFSNIYLFYVHQVIAGFFMAAVDVGANSLMIDLWQADCNPFLQFMHFGFAFGLFVAPTITSPFLSNDVNIVDDDSLATTNTWMPNVTLVETTTYISTLMPEVVTSAEVTESQESQIFYPLMINAALSFLAGALVFVLKVLAPYRPAKREMADQKAGSDENTANLPKFYFYLVIGLGCVVICFTTGHEGTSMSYLSMFVMNIPFKVPKVRSVQMASAFSSAMMMGRVVSIFVATKVSPLVMIYVSIGGAIVGNLINYIFVYEAEAGLWVGFIIIGFFSAPLFATIMAFIEQRVNVTSGVCSLFMFSSVVTAVIMPLVMGSYIEKQPMVFMACTMSCIFIALVVYLGLHATDFMRRHYLGIAIDYNKRSRVYSVTGSYIESKI